MTITHDRVKCIGCGQCASVCPEYWYIDNDGKARMRNSIDKKGIAVGKIDNDDLPQMEEVVKLCPLHLINIQSH